MKIRLITIISLFIANAAHAQEPSLVNSNGAGITNPAFREAVLSGTNVDSTELGYLNNVSSNIQTQFNAKQDNTLAGPGLLGRSGAGSGTMERITLGTNLSFTGSTLNAAGGGSSPWIDVTAAPYNAVADAQIGDGAVMTSGLPTFTVSGANFAVSGLPGKYIRVVGAGASGADLVTTIASRNSATQLTLNANAATSVASAQFVFGTDNSTGVQAALDAANASTTTRTVFIPAGRYLFNVQSYDRIRIMGVGGLYGQSAMNNVNSLAAAATCTVAIPARVTLPVIRFLTAGNMEISNIFFIGNDGTTSTDRLGTAIQIGDPLDTINGAVASGFKISQCEFNGFNFGITASRVWDNVIENVQWNFCNVGFFGGEIDSGGVRKTTGPSDGMSFISCGSNWTAVVFDLRGSKQSTIINGDYNRMQKLALLEESALIGTGVNLETVTSCVFHLFGNNTSRVDFAYLTGIDWTELAWVDSTGLNPNISIRNSSVAPALYKTAAVSGYPQDLPRGARILRYTDSTLTTLRQTEFWDNIARINFRDANTVQIRENWTKGTSSPFGQNSWLGTNIAGTSTFGSETNSMRIFQAAGSVAARLMPEHDIANFSTNWRMSWLFRHQSPSATVFRLGLYSRDTTAAMIPQNGIGLRADTVTAGDTTAQLEVIVGGTIQTTINTGIALASLNNSNYLEMILEKQGATVYLALKNASTGAFLANQVVYSGSVPSLGTPALPGVFLSGSAAQLVNFRQLLFEQIP